MAPVERARTAGAAAGAPFFAASGSEYDDEPVEFLGDGQRPSPSPHSPSKVHTATAPSRLVSDALPVPSVVVVDGERPRPGYSPRSSSLLSSAAQAASIGPSSANSDRGADLIAYSKSLLAARREADQARLRWQREDEGEEWRPDEGKSDRWTEDGAGMGEERRRDGSERANAALADALGLVVGEFESLSHRLAESLSIQSDLEASLKIARSNLTLAESFCESLQETVRRQSALLRASDIDFNPLTGETFRSQSVPLVDRDGSAVGPPAAAGRGSSKYDDVPSHPASSQSRLAPLTPPSSDRRFRFGLGKRSKAQPSSNTMLPPSSASGRAELQRRNTSAGDELRSPSGGFLPSSGPGPGSSPSSVAVSSLQSELASVRDQLSASIAHASELAGEKKTLEDEVEALSQSLFEEANKMVADERKKAAAWEEEAERSKVEKQALEERLVKLEQALMAVSAAHPGPIPHLPSFSGFADSGPSHQGRSSVEHESKPPSVANPAERASSPTPSTLSAQAPAPTNNLQRTNSASSWFSTLSRSLSRAGRRPSDAGSVSVPGNEGCQGGGGSGSERGSRLESKASMQDERRSEAHGDSSPGSTSVGVPKEEEEEEGPSPNHVGGVREDFGAGHDRWPPSPVPQSQRDPSPPPVFREDVFNTPVPPTPAPRTTNFGRRARVPAGGGGTNAFVVAASPKKVNVLSSSSPSPAALGLNEDAPPVPPLPSPTRLGSLSASADKSSSSLPSSSKSPRLHPTTAGASSPGGNAAVAPSSSRPSSPSVPGTGGARALDSSPSRPIQSGGRDASSVPSTTMPLLSKSERSPKLRLGQQHPAYMSVPASVAAGRGGDRPSFRASGEKLGYSTSPNRPEGPGGLMAGGVENLKRRPSNASSAMEEDLDALMRHLESYSESLSAEEQADGRRLGF